MHLSGTTARRCAEEESGRLWQETSFSAAYKRSSEMAETDISQNGEPDNSSSSFVYSIPLQQLRALARATDSGCSAGPLRKQPRLINLRSSSSSFASSRRRHGESKEDCTTGEEKKEGKHFSGRTPSGQHNTSRQSKLEHSQKRPENATALALKKKSNKKLPTEVSNRRPHYATGQPLVRSFLSAVGGDKPLPLWSAGVERSTHTGHGISAKYVTSSTSGRSNSGSNGSGGSDSSSRSSGKSGHGKRIATDCKEVAEFCESRQEAAREDHSPARSLVRLEEGSKKGEHIVRTATADQGHVELLLEETPCRRESDVQGAWRQQQATPGEQLDVHGNASQKEEDEIAFIPQGATREKKLSRLYQEREAALQRHLKSLRSLRMRLATEGRGVAKNHGSRVGREVRDPRFSEACGPLNLRMVGKAYAFLDDMRKKEAEQLQRFLKKGVRRDAGSRSADREERDRAGTARQVEAEKEAAQKALQRLRSQEDARKRKGVELVVKGRLAREEKARIAQTGKKPFFVRRREMKRLVQAEWQKSHYGGNAPGHRRAAKQEEKKARNKLAKERRLNAVPLRRSVVEKINA